MGPLLRELGRRGGLKLEPRHRLLQLLRQTLQLIGRVHRDSQHIPATTERIGTNIGNPGGNRGASQSGRIKSQFSDAGKTPAKHDIGQQVAILKSRGFNPGDLVGDSIISGLRFGVE